MAKSYAIKILEELVPVDEKDTPDSIDKKIAEVSKEYRFHKADNLNRIYKEKEAK